PLDLDLRRVKARHIAEQPVRLGQGPRLHGRHHHLGLNCGRARELELMETVWRLPEFGDFASFEAQGALQNIAVDKQNMEILMQRSNRSQGAIGNNPVPEVTVFSEDPVELGNPNMLICYVDKFWPPMITIKWLKNGQEMVDGVVETVFYHARTTPSASSPTCLSSPPGANPTTVAWIIGGCPRPS
uniref:Ig-like domain-containing protein n=1 Tax=Apteryx owenii TaxID=8824 RepID=A0A8B9QZ72_APTOW